MQFSKDQFSEFKSLEQKRALETGLRIFEDDLIGGDPALHEHVKVYREAGDWAMWHRIVTLTNHGLYQRGLLAICLQSGIDVTTDPNFAYIVRQPALSGNTKARHIILMATAFQRRVETTE